MTGLVGLELGSRRDFLTADIFSHFHSFIHFTFFASCNLHADYSFSLEDSFFVVKFSSESSERNYNV